MSIKTQLRFCLIGGTSLALCFVFLGGLQFLIHHGSDSFDWSFVMRSPKPIESQSIRDLLSANGLITLGLITLLLTQLTRVALLSYDYAKQNDYYFMFIAGFIFVMLSFSMLSILTHLF